MIPPPPPRGPPGFQARVTNFANVGEFAGALSAEQKEELLRVLQPGQATAQGQQGFASGSS